NAQDRNASDLALTYAQQDAENAWDLAFDACEDALKARNELTELNSRIDALAGQVDADRDFYKVWNDATLDVVVQQGVLIGGLRDDVDHAMAHVCEPGRITLNWTPGELPKVQTCDDAKVASPGEYPVHAGLHLPSYEGSRFTTM